MDLNRDTIVGAIAIIAVILGFAATGGINALLWLIALVGISVWSWWLYTFKASSRLIFYGVKVPANILLNPLLLIFLLNSWSQMKMKAKAASKYSLYDSEEKPNHAIKADEK